jgi:integrase
LSDELRLIDLDNWTPPSLRDAEKQAGSITLAEFGERWIKERHIKETTRKEYTGKFQHYIKPKLGNIPLSYLTQQTIQTWHANLATSDGEKIGPTAKAHTYSLLHAILASAVKQSLLTSNPCQIERAMKAKTKKAPIILLPAEVRKLANADAMPERYRALVLIGAACGLRWGEAIELRRKDVELVTDSEGEEVGIIHVHRAVTHKGACRIDSTKSGYWRDVVIPAAIIPDVREHLATFVGSEGESQLFAAARGGCHLNDKVFREFFVESAKSIGRQGLTFHHLRHWQGTMFAQVGGTVKETMVRLGHSTVGAAMIYQNAADERQKELAAKLSALIG